ncbi:hypothetical protein [Polymorphospora lycopeni]|uniref:GATA-type domain-containing protein n=1 Tax=Polymorphospora lycopeni TaxID=3140240 RepID=A0ABV5CKT4_9ACTN
MIRNECPVSCLCHLNAYNPCSVPGGCGSEGCRQTATSDRRACILCPAFRADDEPRAARRPPVCDACRWRLHHTIRDIANLHARLANPEPPIVDRHRYQTTNPDGTPGRIRWADPVARLGGVAPINSRSSQPHVTGSRERPLPTPVDRIDLGAPARPGSIGIATRGHWAARGGDPDQVGVLSVATVLDSWVRDWRESMWPDVHLPDARVDQLADWLLAGFDDEQPGVRIDQACDQHPAIDEMATELRALRQALRRALGETDPQPTPVTGVACATCANRALWRQPGDTYAAECATCGTLYTDTELADHINELAGQERRRRTPEQVAELLRHN